MQIIPEVLTKECYRAIVADENNVAAVGISGQTTLLLIFDTVTLNRIHTLYPREFWGCRTWGREPDINSLYNLRFDANYLYVCMLTKDGVNSEYLLYNRRNGFKSVNQYFPAIRMKNQLSPSPFADAPMTMNGLLLIPEEKMTDTLFRFRLWDMEKREMLRSCVTLSTDLFYISKSQFFNYEKDVLRLYSEYETGRKELWSKAIPEHTPTIICSSPIYVAVAWTLTEYNFFYYTSIVEVYRVIDGSVVIAFEAKFIPIWLETRLKNWRRKDRYEKDAKAFISGDIMTICYFTFKNPFESYDADVHTRVFDLKKGEEILSLKNLGYDYIRHFTFIKNKIIFITKKKASDEEGTSIVCANFWL
jgi:hypothetical protein